MSLPERRVLPTHRSRRSLLQALQGVVGWFDTVVAAATANGSSGILVIFRGSLFFHHVRLAGCSGASVVSAAVDSVSAAGPSPLVGSSEEEGGACFIVSRRSA